MRLQFPAITRISALAVVGLALTAAGPDAGQDMDRGIGAPRAIAEAAAAIPGAVPATATPVTKPALRPTLAAMVADRAGDTTADAQLHCLARAVFFESRGEPLEGQLAVAQVILNRAESGRYPASVCGVIRQRGQFTFDHSRAPAGRDWRIAEAIARIAVADHWREVVPAAMSFHATRVSPGWPPRRRVGAIGNHVFYR